MSNKTGSVLVIGSGIAGMQSSLELANSGFKVYLVERSSSLGGKLTQLDCLICKVCHRYFPQTKDYEKMSCGICYFPKLLEDVEKADNIEVFTQSNIKSIQRKDENFKVQISKLQKPTDKDISIPLEVCLEENKTVQEKEQIIDITAGAIILCPGFEEFDAKIKSEYGYGRYKNVLTSYEFEKMVSPSGPSKGQIIRPSDGKEPKKIAWINCVGSRDNVRGNNYCSSVCCSYSIKEAVLAKEHLPTIEPTIFYMDIRTFAKGLDEYYESAKKEHGVRFIKCRIPEVQEDSKTNNLSLKYENENGTLEREEFDMVVLSVGFRPSDDIGELAKKLEINLNDYGFCETSELTPIKTNQPGIFVCGTFSGPKDIPDTVIEASGAAAEVSALLAEERNKMIEKEEYPPEIKIGESPRIGVFICNCGTNIGDIIDVKSVAEYAKSLPNVVYVEDNLYTCSHDTQNKIIDKIKNQQLSRIIFASGTPRTHEHFFQKIARKAGLNPHLVEIANIRDQCSWVHMKEPNAATEKAKDLVRIAAVKASLLEPLTNISLDVIQKGLVIGGGLTGMTSALAIADQGYEVYLVEKEKELGGNLRDIHYTLGNEKIQEYLESTIKKVENNPRIKIFKNTQLENIEGCVGNYITTLKTGSTETKLEHGIIIVATGAKESKPEEYLYGEDNRVITQIELEKQLAEGKASDKNIIVMIQCVGSRDEKHPYCSRVCCTDAIKNALKLKEKNPDVQIYVLYRDIRTYGFKESFYEEAREKGIIFIRYDPEEKPEVHKGNKAVEVVIRDPILNKKLLINADLVVLSPAIVPQRDNEDIAKLLNVPLDKNGFFLEAHTKFSPTDFTTEGIFLAGMAHSPKSIGESLSQAYAAASRAVTLISRDTLSKDPTISFVVDENCDGCAYCIDPCPYGAVTLLEYMRDDQIKKTVEVNEAICRGCGICMATCPKKGAYIHSFTYDQIMAQSKTATDSSQSTSSQSEFEPRLVAFCCNWCSYTGADLAGRNKIQYSPNVRILRVMCTGMIHPNFVIEALTNGADGVLICGCHPGDCHYLEGNLKTEKRAEAIDLMLEDFGLEPERFRLEWVSASEGQKFAKVVDEMVDELKGLGPSPYSKQVALNS